MRTLRSGPDYRIHIGSGNVGFTDDERASTLLDRASG
jgi:hypothetical protein